MRPTHPGSVSYSFGPGPLTPAVRALVILNVAGYLLALVAPAVSIRLGLVPALVFERWWFWQPVTYMFLHGGLFHLLFNMLALWMFGVDLERRWGTRFFARFYFVSGVGAAATTLLLSLLPFGFSQEMYASVTVGASGAIYGLLVAFAMMYPDRPIYLYMLFPIPARVFVLIIGAISFLSSVSEARGGRGPRRAPRRPGRRLSLPRLAARRHAVHGAVAVAALAPRPAAQAVRRARGRPQGPARPPGALTRGA